MTSVHVIRLNFLSNSFEKLWLSFQLHEFGVGKGESCRIKVGSVRSVNPASRSRSSNAPLCAPCPIRLNVSSHGEISSAPDLHASPGQFHKVSPCIAQVASSVADGTAEMAADGMASISPYVQRSAEPATDTRRLPARTCHCLVRGASLDDIGRTALLPILEYHRLRRRALTRD